MRSDLTPFFDQTVWVVVDRPLGSVHPRWPGLVCLVNYGELPGTISGGGQPVDADLLGWNSPVLGAEAVVVAVILCSDACEDKLIVARPGTVWTGVELWSAAQFQEQCFAARLVTLPR